jgi:hypothetical protein
MLAITPEIMTTCLFDIFFRRLRTIQLVTNKMVNNHINGSTRSGSGSSRGSVVRTNNGPAIYSAASKPYWRTVFSMFTVGIQQVYKMHCSLNPETDIFMQNEKHRFGHGAQLVNKLGARTTNPLL